MTASFIYALSDHVSPLQHAAVDGGLRSLFPNIEFEQRDGAFLTGEIVPIAGRVEAGEPDAIEIDPPPRLLVMEVKTAFAGLLIDALAEA